MDPIRVLFVDDHPIVRQGLETVAALAMDIALVGSASTGHEAIALFRQHKPDVAVIDLALPDMDGMDVLGRMQRESPNAGFLVLSARRGEEDVARALKGGARGYLFKSASPVELLDAIRAVHAGHQFLSKEVSRTLEHDLPEEALTDRETEILARIAAGASNAGIAESLHIGDGTVRWHVHNILTKLGATSRSQAVVLAIKRGWVHSPAE